MKISIDLFDELSLDLALARDVDGRWAVRGLFPTFPGRPGHPHVSIFADDGIESHFTANSGRRNVYRRRLARVGPEQLEAFGKRAVPELVRLQAQSLSPADLATLTTEGWTAHWADQRVISRWLAPHCRPGATLRVDEDSVTSLVLHVCRHFVAPEALVAFGGRQFFPMLRSTGDDMEVRTLFHYPEGIWVPNTTGEPSRIAPAGWYWSAANWVTDEGKARVVPVDRIDRICQRIDKHLQRFPRRVPPRVMDDLPKFAGFILGYYASALLEQIVGLSIQAADAKLEHDVG